MRTYFINFISINGEEDGWYVKASSRQTALAEAIRCHRIIHSEWVVQDIIIK